MAGTVLVVDDSVSMRQLVAFSLKEAGYDVVSAVHGKEALEKIDGTRFDMVITDLNMPEMSGIEFIRQVRSRSEYKVTPIVMLMTETREPKEKEGREAGANGGIVKPFTPQQLVKVVRKFTKQ